MDDLAIKSRIAVIEGHTIEHITGDTVFIFDRNLSDITGLDEYIDYNPLTDDALCFALMVKYKVWRWSNPYCGVFNVCIKGVQGWVTAVTFNKAILLAIIESKKDVK